MTTPSGWAERKEAVDCLLCGSAKKRRVHAKLPWLVRCADCGFAYNSPRITEEAAQEMYSQTYFESRDSEVLGYDNYLSDRSLVELTFRRRLSELERRWLPAKGRLLDVGCAAGFFLVVARRRGWQVDGVEISDYCCRHAKESFGIDLHHGHLRDYRPAAPYDLITMWDYLEHSYAPADDVARSYQLLKPGGVLAIATPDFGSLPAKVFGSRWMGYKEYEHLYYFTRKNLSRMLRAQGFRVERVTSIGKYISLDFFLKRLGSYSGWVAAALSAAAKTAPLDRNVFYCNPFDIAYVVARK